ncbi:glycosyltransferase family 9 protein [uncultured Brachyspira sp.]|uniref:glycosyltransferase family 9 protein n=1 Tax=uncultured Brachyspira sp. TaxID=221953 RepID=UPI0025FC2D9E|nr:glycosyltransferase family 9 protein [uncultured Brachyspira sp.]
MNDNIKRCIDNIVWWIPFKKLRNSLREYLLYVATNHYEKNDSFKVINLNYCDHKKNIAIYFDAGIGDYLMFRPILPFIRDYYKYDKITFIGNDRFIDIVLSFDNEYINQYIYFEGNINNKNVTAKKFFSNINYDILISNYYLRGTWTDDFCKLINANDKIGSYGGLFVMSQRQRTDISAYTKVIYSDENDMFELYRNIHFFEKLFNHSIDISSISIELKEEIFKNINFNFYENYALIFIGATNDDRKWNYLNFQKVCDHLYEKYNIISYIAGSMNDQQIANKIIQNRQYIKSICGKYDINSIFYIINKSKIVISNDSGGYHMAMTVGSNIIVISSGANFIRFINYPDKFKKYKIVSTPIPENSFDNPYYEHYYNKDFLNLISADTICELIDNKHSKYF